MSLIKYIKNVEIYKVQKSWVHAKKLCKENLNFYTYN